MLEYWVPAVDNSRLVAALIDAPDYKTALTLLDGKGYDTSFGSDYSAMLDLSLIHI